MNTEVSLTIPMNMLPMFGIAIFVACGRMICTNTRSGVHAEREPASRWPRGIASSAAR